jgi:HAD superfamily hydrolase (TIGR01549 family)
MNAPVYRHWKAVVERVNLPGIVPELNLNSIKAILFDFGDTLVTLSPSKEELFVRAARSTGLELGIDSVRHAYEIVDFHNKYSSVSVTDRDSFYRKYNEQLCEALGVSDYFVRLHPALVKQFRQDKKWVLIEDTQEALIRLDRREMPLALVANWGSNLEDLTGQLGIRHFFSVIVSSQSAGVEKPNPLIFKRAVDEFALSTQTDRILYVGNEYRADVSGARAAGLTPVLIDKNGTYPHADCLRFTSLLQWLNCMQ